jgi:hypothetical protein
MDWGTLIRVRDSIEMNSDLLVLKLRKSRKMLITLLRKFIRICFLTPYHWFIRRIKKLFQSMRRILKYRVPLGYILLVKLISIEVGIYTWVAFLREDQTIGDTIHNFINL